MMMMMMIILIIITAPTHPTPQLPLFTNKLKPVICCGNFNFKVIGLKCWNYGFALSKKKHIRSTTFMGLEMKWKNGLYDSYMELIVWSRNGAFWNLSKCSDPVHASRTCRLPLNFQFVLNKRIFLFYDSSIGHCGKVLVILHKSSYFLVRWEPVWRGSTSARWQKFFFSPNGQARLWTLRSFLFFWYRGYYSVT